MSEAFETANAIEAVWSGEDLRAEEFDHVVWSRARGVRIARYWSGEAAPPEKQAEARLVWCESALVVRFDCRQVGPLVVNPEPMLDRKVIGLWERDVCEIFVAPDPARPERYFEFEAAPNGEHLDIALLWRPDGRDADWDYRSGMTTAARLGEGELTITMRLPWAAFGRKPKAGDHWRCNLFRCVGTDPRLRYLAWLPTHTPEPQFHVPHRFGRLDFEAAG